MAFDRPLEADRVDDLNLFSVFVRAPVVGTLLWLVGGSRAVQEQEEEEERRKARSDLVSGAGSSSSLPAVAPSSALKPSGSTMNLAQLQQPQPQQPARRSALKKKPPRLIGSDCSIDMGESSGALEDMNGGSSLLQRRRKKELSWSDESGRSLVEIVGESNDSVSISDTSTRTAGTGLTRSRSVRAHADHMAKVQDDVRRIQQQGETRYLPRGLDKAHNGIIVPRRPYGVDQNYAPSMEPHQSDVDGPSPQWGWFMRTTPPTPPMFHCRPPPATYSSSSDSSLTSSSSDGKPQQQQQHYQPNPIFQSMQNKHREASAATASMGWSSVPL